ncbi:MAG TPA: SDR family oxidoreductase [Steroidobacteraceae bacterium]|nr:SDR family oxidoreductase [Steroidobacteraceae bacterium]
MQDLVDKVVFVTGGVSGLGLGIARAFSAAGAKVVITYMREAHRDLALAQFREAKGRVHALKLDVTDREALALAADDAERVFGPVDILVNNAGVNVFGPMDEATYEDWDWILGVNLGGVINCIVTFIPRLKSRGTGGHIVNVASMAALITGPMAGIYTTSKFALRGLSECLRDCLNPYGIGVSVFCPGLVKSNIGESTINRPAHLAHSGFKVDAATMKLWNELHSPGMDPVEAGEAVVRGVQRNDSYIFSHPEHRQELRQIFDEILAAIPEGTADAGRLAVEAMRRAELAAIRGR